MKKSGTWKRWLIDTAERTVRTFIQGFLAVFTLDQVLDRVTTSIMDQVYGGLIAGAYAVLMAFAAKPSGAPDSASFLPEEMDPPA